MKARKPNGIEVSISKTVWEIVAMSGWGTKDDCYLRQLVYYDGPKAYPQFRYQVQEGDDEPIELPHFNAALALYIGYCTEHLRKSAIIRHADRSVVPLAIEEESK